MGGMVNRTFAREVQRMGELMRRRLQALSLEPGNGSAARRWGLALEFDCEGGEIAEATSRKAFKKGLIVEACGSVDQVAKVFAALTIDADTLNQGFQIFEKFSAETLNQPRA